MVLLGLRGHTRCEAVRSKLGRKAGGTPLKRKQASRKRTDDAYSKQEEMLASLSGTRAASPAAPASGKGDERQEDGGFTVIERGHKVSKDPVRRVEGSLYDHPDLYDWINSFHEFEDEVDFIFDGYEMLTGKEPESCVELGSGPAQHSLELAESGLHVYAIDNNSHMVHYAQTQAEADNVNLTCLHQDMRRFQLPDEVQVDIVCCLNGTFQHMLTVHDARQCFAAARAALQPGGLFVIELTHPALLFDGSVIQSGDTWKIDTPDCEMEVFWGQKSDCWNPVTQILERTITVDVALRAGEHSRLHDKLEQRQYTFQELLMLSELEGFQFVRAFNDFDLKSEINVDDGDIMHKASKGKHSFQGASAVDLDDPFRMICFLQKPTES